MKRTATVGVVVAALLGLLAIPSLAEAKRNLYISTLAASGTISAFDFTATGGLQSVGGSPFAANSAPRGLSITPDGSYLYASNFDADTGATDTDTVSAFKVDSSGALTELAGSPYAVGNSPNGTAITPDGSYLYVANANSETISSFRIAANGSLTTSEAAVPTGSGPASISVHPDGSYLYVSNRAGSVSSFRITTDGALEPLGSPTATGAIPIGTAITPDGDYLFVANQADSNISTFKVSADGTIAEAGTPTATGGSFPTGLSLSPDGSTLYSANTGSDDVSVLTIDGGQLTALTDSPYASVVDPYQGVITPDGTRLYAGGLTSGGATSGFEIGASAALNQLTGSPFSEESTAPDLQGLAITPNQPPTSRFQFLSPATVGESVLFDASAATDSDGDIATYAWNFGDGESTTESDATVSHAFDAPGSYTVALTLTDDEGCSRSFVSTGQTAYCNGSNQAQSSAVIEVTDDPTPTPTPVDPDTTITDLDVTAKKKQTQKGKKIKIKLKGGAGEAVTGIAKGKIKVKRKGKKKNRAVVSAKNFKLKKVTKQTEGGEQTVYRLKPKKRKDTKKIFKLLGRGKDLRANPSIKFTDEAGNTATERRVVRLKLKKK